ncbi:MAG: IS5 family transposase [Aquabacterium sp.]|nr:IS5 family transposase [Aquabacterium sp.]
MKQANLGLNLSSKRTRKREFLDEMNHVVPWAALVELILPYYPAGTVVDATLINTPSSTKNAKGERDPEMHQTQKGQQWYFGMKAHIGVDADSGLVHSVRGTAANVNDVVEGKAAVNWHVAMQYSKRKVLNKDNAQEALSDQIERIKGSIRAKVEHPFRVLKRQFGYVKVRYRGLKKNTAQITTLFALSNLWMARHKLMAAQADSSAWTGSCTDCMGQAIQDLVDG